MPPVTNGQFSFNVDTFYVATSGGQIHRRAAPAEIKALYDTSTTDKSTPDHPGHWYEAQLLHYGLPPSKVKATAKMRLLKAVQNGGLSVPEESLQIEKNLKKEWKKQDSNDQAQVNTKITTTKTVTTKTITVSKTTASKTPESKTTASKGVNKPTLPKAAAKTSAVKSAATKTATPKVALTKKDTAPKTVAPKPTAAKSTAAKLATIKAALEAAKPASIKAAAKSAGGKSAAAKPTTPKAAPGKRKRASDDETPDQPQIAKRRVNSKKAQDNANASKNRHYKSSGWSEQPEHLDAPPSYESACRTGGGDSFDSLFDVSEDFGHHREPDTNADPPSPPRALKKTLGMLNGTYKDSRYLSASMERRYGGAYEFGAFEGVLWMPERPMKSSFDRVPFKWRGRETGEGEMSYEDDQEGWIEFLGDGDIVGMISCYGDLHFRGQRIDSSVRTASDLRSEWDGYNDEAWAEENRRRWGGW
ncbi:uncharacterized protein N7500_005970 [Penicillium coprophilum]|uniref:uncharacterized protein n=1 Tax=Penicillium coprophilum TaxID=36646 RepID=UPI00239D9663|nr:uncharacterized protein N7500_005970 [Penicillium coprophilum]KAJ5164140.1 hypothetical protein N7500_005970 [Penicillium coprophilum]